LAGSPVAMLTGVMQALNEPNGAVDTGMGQFAISSSGHLVYASGGISPSYIYSIVRVDRKGTETDLKAPKDRYITERISPDGQKIAVFKGGDFGGIWVVDAGSGNSIRLTSEGSNTWPIWSPDGKRIIFSGGSQFTAITADGSGTATPLAAPIAASGPFAYAASWSADGKWLAYLENTVVGFQSSPFGLQDYS
jgi:Tol biopolymer transport system component